jgi:hypothetical protein
MIEILPPQADVMPVSGAVQLDTSQQTSRRSSFSFPIERGQDRQQGSSSSASVRVCVPQPEHRPVNLMRNSLSLQTLDNPLTEYLKAPSLTLR